MKAGGYVYKKFENIDVNNEKVKKIINASFEVFSNNDYEKASTNMIVKKADISRGVLYYYFKDKEELYNFLIYFSYKSNIEALNKNIDWTDSDFLNRVKQTLNIKKDIMTEFQHMPMFMTNNDVKARGFKLKNMCEGYKLLKDRIFEENIDFSNLKDGVDVEMFKKIVVSSLKGELNDYIEKNGNNIIGDDIAKLNILLDKQLDFFRNHFYKS